MHVECKNLSKCLAVAGPGKTIDRWHIPRDNLYTSTCHSPAACLFDSGSSLECTRRSTTCSQCTHPNRTWRRGNRGLNSTRQSYSVDGKLDSHTEDCSSSCQRPMASAPRATNPVETQQAVRQNKVGPAARVTSRCESTLPLSNRKSPASRNSTFLLEHSSSQSRRTTPSTGQQDRVG